MKVGLMVPLGKQEDLGRTLSYPEIRDLALRAEAAGLDSVWIYDHLIFHFPEKDPAGVWEGWTIWSALAEATKRVELGALVLCVPFRNPAVLAKMAVTLDEVSGGRIILGLGAGWHQPEYSMFGLPFNHRVDRFEDAIKIVQPLLREGRVDYQGEFYQAHDAVNLPRGPRGAEGGPPILVGTNGPRMMRLTATYADAWNSDWHHDPATVKPLLDQLDGACRAVGRDPATLVRTAGSNIALPGCLGRRPNPITGDPDDIARAVAAFRDLGLRHYVAGLDPCTPTSLDQFAKIIGILDNG